jgi:hypothetical protein
MCELAIKYRLTAEHCFSVACAGNDPVLRQQWLDTGLYWFRLAEQAEARPRPPNRMRLSVV